VVLFLAESSVCFLSFSCLCFLFVCSWFCLIRRSLASFPFSCFAGVVFTASGAGSFFFAEVFISLFLSYIILSYRTYYLLISYIILFGTYYFTNAPYIYTTLLN
jgi:hypothetical protein